MMPLTDLNALNLAVIGGGNMAQALIRGLIQKGVPAAQIHVQEINPSTRESLQQTYGVSTYAQAGVSFTSCTVCLWAIKPQQFGLASQAVRPWTKSALHLSVLAGIRTETLQTHCDTARVIRAMPNTPALIGQGMTALFADSSVSLSDRQWAQGLMASVGSTLWVEQESQMDAVTALSGSGPAYVFYLAQALVEAGELMGLSTPQARTLVLQTFSGAAQLAIQSPDSCSLSELQARVTSKGGTTEAALTVLERQEVAHSLQAAARAAFERSLALGLGLGLGLETSRS
jgi:pyrroline-5-carboxylate reductase